MHCDRCPVPAGLPCLGEQAPPLCRDVAAGMKGRAEQLVAIAEDRQYTPPASEVDARLAMEADLCAAGTGPCGCGAEPRICSRPGRPLEVWRRYCLACARREWWEG